MSELLQQTSTEIIPETIIQSTIEEEIPEKKIAFQMYDSYYDILNNEFNDFLRSNYLDENLNIYLNQNNSARCPEILDPTSAEIKTFPLQEQQKFIKKYINQTTPFRGLLVWHGLGSGKTCASIAVANTFIKKNKVIVVPAALVNNFIGDYSNCGDITAIFDVKKDEMPRTVQIDDNPVSGEFNNFKSFTSNGNINNYKSTKKEIFENKLIIIDESQLLIDHITNAIIIKHKIRDLIIRNRQALLESEIDENTKEKILLSIREKEAELSKPNNYINFYNDLRRLEKSKIICLSGTPIVKEPMELAVLFNIIHGDIVSWEIKQISEQKFTNVNEFISSIPDEKIRNNIDLKNNYFNSDDSSITVYKNPYDFVNININENLGIVYDEINTCTNFEFGTLLKQLFGENNVTENTRSLFETDDSTTIINIKPSVFKHKINGLSSYFGNIQSILPRVELTDVEESDGVFLTNNNLYKYGIGEGNTSKELYEIRYVNTSELTKTIVKLNKTINKKSPDKSTSLLSSIVSMVGLINANTYQFLYPELIEYIQSNADITTKLNIPKVKGATVEERNDEMTRIEEIKQRSKFDLSEMKTKLKSIHSLSEEKEKEKELLYKELSLKLSKPSFVLNEDILGHIDDDDEEEQRTSNNLSAEEIAELALVPVSIPEDVAPTSKEELRDIQFIDNKRDLYKTKVYLDTIPIVKNIWNIDDFKRTYGDKFNVSNPACELKQYSPKIYEIVKSVIGNPGKIHIIYSEFLQVNIPLIRALQANSFNEYDGEENFDTLSNSPRYMFYTGTGVASADFSREDVQFIRFLKDETEGKSKKDRDKLLKNFNSIPNKLGEKVQVIIINSAAAEGITIKNVRFVHLLHLPPNMSKVFQIIGRAIRN